MRASKIVMVSTSGAIGAAIGGALFAAGSMVQAVGWHPRFAIAGALAGAVIGIGMWRRQVQVTTAAALAGASIPPAMAELSFDDGSFFAIPIFGAFVGWTIAALGRRVIIRRRSLNTIATGALTPHASRAESLRDGASEI